MTATTYYLIQYRYVGPNDVPEPDMLEISTMPARTNSSGETCVDGWCGTTNDWATYAHGMHPNFEAAEAAAEDLLEDEFREDDLRDIEYQEPGLIARYFAGRYKPMNPRDTADALGDSVIAEVTLGTDPVEWADEVVLACETDHQQTPDRSTLVRMAEERIEELR